MIIIFSKRLQTIRKMKGISQVELSKALGVSKQSVSNWENDNIQPSIEVLLKISKYFKVSTDYLLGVDAETYGKSRTVDVSGLSEETIVHLQYLIHDLKRE